MHRQNKSIDIFKQHNSSSSPSSSGSLWPGRLRPGVMSTTFLRLQLPGSRRGATTSAAGWLAGSTVLVGANACPYSRLVRLRAVALQLLLSHWLTGWLDRRVSVWLACWRDCVSVHPARSSRCQGYVSAASWLARWLARPKGVWLAGWLAGAIASPYTRPVPVPVPGLCI